MSKGQISPNSFLSRISDEARSLPIVTSIEAYLRIPPWLQLMLCVLWLFKLCLTGEIGPMLATLVGTVYPCFRSIKALKTAKDLEDDKVWLAYWVVYGVSTTLDLYLHCILKIIPFYFTAKLLFYLWLQLPLGPLMGAGIIYRFIFKPIYNIFGR